MCLAARMIADDDLVFEYTVGLGLPLDRAALLLTSIHGESVDGGSWNMARVGMQWDIDNASFGVGLGLGLDDLAPDLSLSIGAKWRF